MRHGYWRWIMKSYCVLRKEKYNPFCIDSKWGIHQKWRKGLRRRHVEGIYQKPLPKGIVWESGAQEDTINFRRICAEKVAWDGGALRKIHNKALLYWNRCNSITVVPFIINNFQEILVEWILFHLYSGCLQWYITIVK